MNALKNELYMQITKQTDTVTSTVRELQRKEIASHRERARALEALSARDVELADTRRQKACLELSLETAHTRIAALERENGTLKRAEEKLKGDMQKIGEMAQGHRRPRKHMVEEIEDTSDSDESGTGPRNRTLGVVVAAGDGSSRQKRQKTSDGNDTRRSTSSQDVHRLRDPIRSPRGQPSSNDAQRARISGSMGYRAPHASQRVTEAGSMQGARSTLSGPFEKPSSATGSAAHAGPSPGGLVFGRGQRAIV